MNNQYQNREVCLYYVGYEKDRARGLRPDFLEEKCENCQPQNQSSITCKSYINKKHLEEFQKLFTR